MRPGRDTPNEGTLRNTLLYLKVPRGVCGPVGESCAKSKHDSQRRDGRSGVLGNLRVGSLVIFVTVHIFKSENSPGRKMAATEVQRRLREKLDKFGWKPPWHQHFRTVVNGVGRPRDPKKPPIYIELCSAAECEATGCPRTESGFKE